MVQTIAAKYKAGVSWPATSLQLPSSLHIFSCVSKMTSEMMYGSWSLRVDNSKPTLEALVDTPVNDAKHSINTPVVMYGGNHNSKRRNPLRDHD